ncbi:MAG: hypothetical protein A2086_14550 [Spirochaetes bacterium GWD1_27_9]|nr:MAG: hypothetical protein A2Z98_18600 [Spirochaetes bacterium GWB1_27_13]OHD20232.1 MAG: hypothetical protein A2Y34_04840 [Spirochaetes bacterium GWC1_27_15]OHD42581.1 MAG: hypothetical protein A2086_14550 [Spirochaetes bacterium GWD1_27_9]
MENNLIFINNVKKYKRDDGLTILLEENPKFLSVALGLFIKRGSRDELFNQAGLSHFCEHMIFKGTQEFQKDHIAQIFDEMGGYLNAYTSYELVVLHNRIPNFYLEKALKIMYDMFNGSVFDEKETDLERDVILNEIKSTMEDPSEKIHEDFMFNLFPEQGLGLPIIGTEESITSVSRDTLFDFYKNIFSSDDLILVISGNFSSEKILDYLNTLTFRRCPTPQNKKANQGEKKSFFTEMPSEQLHLMMGTSKFNLNEDTYISANLLNIIIGESMSSRFFQRIREELGLCYSIYTYIHKYREETIFGLYTSIMPKNVNKTINNISLVIKELLKDGITKEELEQAKKQKIGEIILNSDILQKRMQRIAQMEIRFGKQYDENYVIEKINKTTIDDLNELIKQIFIQENFLTQALYKKKVDLAEWNF